MSSLTRRIRYILLAIAATIAFLPTAAAAAPGDLDTSFGNPDANSFVNSVAVQGDGKVLIGGFFTTVGGVARNRVARLNADGTVDASFTNPNPDSGVYSVAVQGDGKVLIGGDFTTVGGVARNRVTRLNADGTLDTSFGDPNVDNAVFSVAVQGDGKVLIGGDFTTVGGVARNRVARLLGTTPQVAPQGVRAAAGQEQATVSWTAVTGQISSYTATASPGGRTCTTTTTSCTVTGLTAGTAYTFTVSAANEFGSGPASSPSNAVTPTGAASQQASPALSAAVSASRARVTSGQSLRIGIRMRNTGTAQAQKVVSCITLPSNFAIVSARGATRSARTLCFNVGTLAAGASASRAITVRAVSARTVRRVITGTTQATGVARVKATRKAVTITARAVSPRVTG
ncbi:MAG: fibronectin type III domain-containing protein [Actinomycetota bacterium]